jgi:hypothetical protein
MLVLRTAIWDYHHQQCEAPRGTAYLSTDIRPGNAGRAALRVRVMPKRVSRAAGAQPYAGPRPR